MATTNTTHTLHEVCGGTAPDRSSLPDETGLKATVSLLSAAAHPTRLLVLLALSRHGELCAGDLQALASIEQSAMSHQLRALREARIVRSERRGKHVVYELHDHHISHIINDALAHAVEM